MRKRTGFFLCFLLLALLCCTGWAGCSGPLSGKNDFLSTDQRQWLDERTGKLDVLMGYDAPPNIFRAEDGTGQGILVDFLREIERLLDFEFSTHDFTSWNKLIKYAETGRDFIVVGIAPTRARSEYLSFTAPFLKVPYIIVTRKNAPFATMKGLAGAKVCTVAHYAINDYIADHYPLIHPTGVKNNLQGLRSVADGRFDAMVINQLYASYIIEKQGLANLRIAGESGYLNRLCAATSRRNPQLFAIVEKAVDQISPQARQAIYSRWLHNTRSLLENDTFLMLLAGGAALVMLLTVSWVWCRSLRRALHKKTREQQLHLNRYRAIFENSPLGLARLGRHGKILDCNDNLPLLMGAPRERLIGTPAEQWLGPDILQPPEDTSGPSQYAVEFKRRLPDSRENRYLRGVFNHLTSDGQTETIATFEDITDRKKALKELEESERRFRTLFEDMEMIAVQGYDESRRVVYWNRASQQLYGYSREEAMGRNLEDLIIPDHMREQVVHDVQAWVHHDIPIGAGELLLHTKHGSEVPVYSSHVMLTLRSGRREMYCVDVDLSDVKKALAELEQAKNEAESANQSKSLFLANMSHELRTPLNGIMGMHQLLGMTRLDPEQKEYVRTAAFSAKRLTTLLSDILDLSRIEVGKLEFHNEPFNLRNAIQQVEQLFRPLCREKGLKLLVDMDESLPSMPVGDVSRLQQILNNLIGNATKFTEKGHIGLDVTPIVPGNDGNYRILFTVHDTGIGIADSQLDALFEAFVQAEEGLTRKYQGAGLGLSIVKKLVRDMGGNISVESSPGQGTAFHICLPFGLGQETPEDRDFASEEAAGPLPQLKILVAEDDDVNQTMLVKLLEKKGCSVIAVADGEKALHVLGTDRFDMVFMDIQMPLMDGVRATQEIRAGKAGEAHRDIPIIALTAFAMTGDREHFLHAGMNDYLAKPVEGPDIMRILRKYAATRNRPAPNNGQPTRKTRPDRSSPTSDNARTMSAKSSDH
jgi:PAS domain S-box-containing protein